MAATIKSSDSRSQWQQRLTIPSYIVSLMVHVCLLFIAFSSLGRFGDGTMRAVEGEQLAEVGLYVRDDPTAQQATAPESVTSESDTSEEEVQQELPQENELGLDSADQFLELPPESEPQSILGAGRNSQLPVPQENAVQRPRQGEVTDRGPLASPPVGALGPGETEFFNIREKAISLVYVVDQSVSMRSFGAMGVAVQELMASLEHLDSKNKFQIVFYNEQSYPLLLKGDRFPKLYPASTVNRTLARQFIENRQPDLSTEHLAALQLALKLKPDAIFFLTDAGEPAMTTPQLQKIKRLNNGRSRINCIEFGERAEVSRNNFLKRLASDNGGTYRYRDVTKFKAQR